MRLTVVADAQLSKKTTFLKLTAMSGIEANRNLFCK